jgi:alkanesulfonate monooxygenase SsuD/methylene tetrahydromethanopterin reductase-like flavin-dependent oxidoreductase (luciferase family)
MTRDHLVDSAEVIPASWFAEGAAIGDNETCAERAKDYLAAGADEILVHGASPLEARGMVEAFRSTR